MSLTPRGRALRWMTRHRGLTENPPGSNSDRRKDGIRAAQLRLGSWLVGSPWCGSWVASALLHAGVRGVTYRLAAVRYIQADAKAERRPFHGWTPIAEFTKADWEKSIHRGDLITLFGGAHVEMLRHAEFDHRGRLRYCVSDGGNTSPGSGGSQDNGGGSYRRIRYPSQIDGVARVDYPGGR